MAWLLLVSALLLHATALIFAASTGLHTERGDEDAILGGFIATVLCQVCGITLLLAAGMMFGGA